MSPAFAAFLGVIACSAGLYQSGFGRRTRSMPTNGAHDGPGSWVGVALRRAGFDMGEAQALQLWAVSVVLGVLGAAVAGPFGWLVLATALAGPAVVVISRRHHADRQVEAVLPDALDEVARSLRSGSSLPVALADVALTVGGPLGDDLGLVTARLNAGLPLADALASWRTKRPLSSVELAVTALRVAAAAGGSAAQAVDGVGETLRDQHHLRREVAALASQAKASALLIGALPLVFGIGAGLSDSRTAGFLFGTRTGLICLAAGLILDIIALFWMRRIVQGVVVG